jgi:hypothetical protein
LARFAGEDAASLGEAFAHPVAAGFIEPAAARYLLDYGHYATMSVDGKRLGGRSGALEHVSRTATLELWDFGVPVDSLDWSRLPSFRAPGQGPAS